MTMSSRLCSHNGQVGELEDDLIGIAKNTA
jgi:hypothetical protein